jgi:hypothetical protein
MASFTLFLFFLHFFVSFFRLKILCLGCKVKEKTKHEIIGNKKVISLVIRKVFVSGYGEKGGT